MDDDYHHVPGDVRDAVSRIAAALYLGDAQRAGEVLDTKRLQWRTEAVREAEQARKKDADEENRMRAVYGGARAIFRTADGLEAVADLTIFGEGGYFPRVIKRPVFASKTVGAFVDHGASHFESRHVRMYDMTDQLNRDGLRIYEEKQ